MSFPVDTVNRSLLFTAFLEKEGKINRSQIIRFLMDHAQKMEHTWDNMQVLVANITPASGPQSEPKTPARNRNPRLRPDGRALISSGHLKPAGLQRPRPAPTRLWTIW